MTRSRASSKPQPVHRSRSRSASRGINQSVSSGTSLGFPLVSPTRSNDSVTNSSRSRASSFIGRYITNTTSVNSPFPQHKEKLFSLYKLLSVELNLPEENTHDSNHTSQTKASKKQKQEIEIIHSLEQISNLVKIPVYLEKFMLFGLLVCLNSFLTLFTLVPLKFAITFFQIVRLSFSGASIPVKVRLLSIKRDIFTVSLIIIAVCVLSLPNFDISRLYHDVRGLAQIKLYVMFGVLEVADKLLSTIGQDILNILYTVNLDLKDLKKFLAFGTLAIFYLTCHGYILIYQAVSLNVAANSYSNALLALLLSNQFSELKSSVFKKFEREGLFQMAMADLTERFQLSLMLSVIALRNIIQINSIHTEMIPSSWASWNKWLGAIVGPSIVVIGSEILVDWLKHCYITKFNKVRPRVYQNFLYVLSLDYLEVFNDSTRGSNKNDNNDYIVLTRRIGLPLLSTIVCFLRMALSDLKQIFFFNSPTKYSIMVISLPICILAYATLLLIRLILGMLILKWANTININHKQYQLNLRQKRVLEELTPLKVDFVEEVTQESPCPDSDINVSKTSANAAYRLLESQIVTPPLNTPTSPKSPMELSFLPGVPNTEPSTINPNTRSYLYDYGESVPPTPEERRNKQLALETEDDEGLAKVMRYKMASKRIW